MRDTRRRQEHGGLERVQGYSYLKHHGLDLDPDAVTLYFGYDDFLPGW